MLYKSSQINLLQSSIAHKFTKSILKPNQGGEKVHQIPRKELLDDTRVGTTLNLSNEAKVERR